ncbi:acyl transferase domain-containing protein [Phthorimaea operculella]|nr:acyl transferase domain-containing protein [Phthorimaea operculella]
MAPSPQEGKDPIAPHPQNLALTGEEVVISGISGQFPNSKNVVEFMDNLYNKVEMITKNDPIFEHADLPSYSGKISDIEKFDAQFFRVTAGQADSMDPVGRKLMEHAYGAMYDAGVNPISCKGKNIGVFISSYVVEACKLLVEDINTNPFLLSGTNKTMQANRISYWLDAKGPSFTFDTTAGSIQAVQHAVRCIKSGECDAALVGSGEIPLDPILNINMRKVGISSLDSKTRCFEKNGDGSVLSQAIGLLFLQKAKDAKRIYAEVYCSGSEYGLKDGDNMTQARDPKRIVEFLSNVYSESGLLPQNVEYVEAHGAAHPEADANELEAIAEVFGKHKPVMVGCVKSNIGDTLPVASICSITKLCLAYNKGLLPGNLDLGDPLDIPAIKTGKIEILTNNKRFNGGLTAINSFSHTGADCHLVLKGHIKPKNMNQYKLDIPRLVVVSGRHEKSVEVVFDNLKNQPLDAEFIGMLNDIYQVETPGFTCRGYTILDTSPDLKETVTLSQSTHLNQEAAPPLWLLYSGMGSQWAGMGKELLRIPMFAATVQRCHKVLEPKGVDVMKIITSPDKTMFENVFNCFIGIAAVQIGLTNMLKELGLVADNVIGHSVGELGCAHYDDCFTDEEMILAAYARGLVSIQTKLIKGSMAAVGLGYADMLPLCPPSIDVACHNSSEVCTISGPAADMKTFVAELTAKGMTSCMACGNIAYHSRYIQDAVQIGGKEFENERMFQCVSLGYSLFLCSSQHPEYLIPVILKLTKKRRHRSLGGVEDPYRPVSKQAPDCRQAVRPVAVNTNHNARYGPPRENLPPSQCRGQRTRATGFASGGLRLYLGPHSASPPAERNGRSIRAATWGKSSDHFPTYEDLKSFLEAESRRVDVQAGEASRRPLPSPPGTAGCTGEEATVATQAVQHRIGIRVCLLQETGHGVAACQEFAAQRVQRRRGVHSRGVGVFGAGAASGARVPFQHQL